MAKIYSREELMMLGMDEEQISAVLATYERDGYVTNKTTSGSTGVIVPISTIDENKIPEPTSIADLQAYSKGTLVRFPDFAEGQPFIARVRRPSMLVMAKQGKIPNTLLVSANELFAKGGGMDSDDERMLADIYDICEIICEAALKEPTYQQIKDAGLELSDNQLMAIFNYTQAGAKALESFR